MTNIKMSLRDSLRSGSSVDDIVEDLRDRYADNRWGVKIVDALQNFDVDAEYANKFEQVLERFSVSGGTMLSFE